MTTRGDEDAVAELFRQLEKAGLATRCGEDCCGGHAHMRAREIVLERRLRGAVYYHQQDLKELREADPWDRCLPLGFGTARAGTRAERAEEEDALGREIVRLCEGLGLQYEWPGTALHRIRVLVPGWGEAR